MTSSLFAIVGLRARELTVTVDSVLMPEDQTDANATMLKLRCQMNPEIRVTTFEIVPADTNETVTERLGLFPQAKLVEIYCAADRL